MRLRELEIKNFGCIDEVGYTVEIDDIVVLIGPNNVGKSSILDAYEAFAGVGAALPLRCFRNQDTANSVSISAVFADIDSKDMDVLGAKWNYKHPKYGPAIQVKWQWTQPDEKGKKFSWDPQSSSWTPGGVGGWDSLIASRVPAPLRIRPTDDAATTEGQVVEILTAAVKAAIKADEGRTSEVIDALRKLTTELAAEVQDKLTEATGRIAERLSAVFPGYQVQLEPQVGKFEPEKAVGTGSHIRVKGPTDEYLPLAQQGAGLRRTFLWSALETLADLGRAKLGKALIDPERPRILLLEEPESFLHPPLVRSAREALYSLAELPEWQVIATTHSPVFIDMAKPHTTIVRVARHGEQRTRLFSTDRASFSDEDRENLRMIRSCHPTVAEFFFADHVVLVEGETEQAILHALLEREAPSLVAGVHVVNCIGKANLPMFQRILNQFGTRYTVVHDGDAPNVCRDGQWQRNPMWTINGRIRDALAERSREHPPCTIVCHVPDFEHHYFGRSLVSDKPYQALRVVLAPDFPASSDYTALRGLIAGLIDGSHPATCRGTCEGCARTSAWAAAADGVNPEAWTTA